MPGKCPFCRRKYIRSGTYEKHLGTAHGGLNIVLASTVHYINIESCVSHNTDASERQDSACESDRDPAGSEPDEFCGDIAYKSDTEVFEDATSPSAGTQIHYEGAGQVIGDVDGFEHEYSNLCDDPWALFNSEQGFKLASWFIEGKVSKSRINEYFARGLGDINQSGIAPCTRWRTISGYWIRTVNICNGSKDRLRMAKELCHLFTATY